MRLLIPLFSLIVINCLTALSVGEKLLPCDVCTASDRNGDIVGVTQKCYDAITTDGKEVGFLKGVTKWPSSCTKNDGSVIYKIAPEFVPAQCKKDVFKILDCSEKFPCGDCLVADKVASQKCRDDILAWNLTSVKNPLPALCYNDLKNIALVKECKEELLEAHKKICESSSANRLFSLFLTVPVSILLYMVS